MTRPKSVIVIGAGICGLSAAIWARRAGCEVMLLDKDQPGAGASYGNAGLLAQWSVTPVNTPGIARKAAGYLARRKGPLFVQWAHVPRMIPWLLKFMANANDAEVRRISAGLVPLLSDAVDQHRALTRGTLAEKWIATSALSYAYRDRTAFEADHYVWDLKRAHGYDPEILEDDAVQEEEPILGQATRLLARMPAHGHILNPGAYMADLARVLADEGGRYVQAEVLDLTLSDGRITAVQTDRGAFGCDAAVLAAGIWSRPLMRKLGLRVPLEAERGHHVQFFEPSQVPRNPIMIASAAFVATPMQDALRCAGTVEMGGLDRTPSRAPIRSIRSHVAQVFPDLTWARDEEWVGFRPSTPDSLPLIGEIGQTGVHAAFGHQHIGLTGGPRTGRWVAELIAGRRPNIDLSPYDANRFG